MSNDIDVKQSTMEEAEPRRARVRVGAEHLNALITDISDAYQRRDWLTLGYESWEGYVEDNLASAKLRIPREQRRELVGTLREAGMSTRAIASATGTSIGTAHADLSTCSELNTSPVDVSGLDGKSYSVSSPSPAEEDEGPLEAELVEGPAGSTSASASLPEQPRKSHRAPLDKSATNAGWNIRKAVERCQRVVTDDRYPKNKDQVTRALRGHLAYTVEIAESLLDTLPEIDQKTGEVSE